MFTGIVSHIGEIKSIAHPADWEISIELKTNYTSSFSFKKQELFIGASISCSGICLTLKKISNNFLFFDISNETASKTIFFDWKVGSLINIEKSLKVGDEIGGHFVYGHVDTTASVQSIQEIEGSYKITFFMDSYHIKFIASKGSVTIDGVSLTVNEVDLNTFSVNIIPFTWSNTNFKNYVVNTNVNIEIDVLARYLDRLNEMK